MSVSPSSSTNTADAPEIKSAEFADAKKSGVGAGTPPWLWLWVLFRIAALPSLFAGLGTLARMYQSAVGKTPLSGLMDVFALAAHALIYLSLLVGIVAALLPRLRARYVARANALSEATDMSAVWFQEIRAFLDIHAPELAIHSNLARVDQLCSIYPIDKGSTIVAVFGGFVKLWRADRMAAQSILLNKIEHYRRGDDLLLGPGSPLEGGIRISWIALICTLVALVVFKYSPVALSPFYKSAAVLMVPSLLIPLFIPTACIWLAEFNADRFAIDRLHTPLGVERSFEPLRATLSGWARLCLGMTRPPAALRRWMVDQPETTWTVCGSLVLIVALLLTTVIEYFTVYSGGGMAADLWGNNEGGHRFFSENALWLLVMALGAYFWPVIAPRWDHLFSRTMPDYRMPVSRTRAIWAAVPITALVLSGIIIAVIDQNLAANDQQNPVQIIGVWKLRDHDTFVQFLYDGKAVLMYRDGRGRIAAAGAAYSFGDSDAQIQFVSRVTLDTVGAFDVSTATGDDTRGVEVHVRGDELSMGYQPDSPDSHWSRVAAAGNLLDLFNAQNSDMYSSRRVLAQNTDFVLISKLPVDISRLTGSAPEPLIPDDAGGGIISHQTATTVAGLNKVPDEIHVDIHPVSNKPGSAGATRPRQPAQSQGTSTGSYHQPYPNVQQPAAQPAAPSTGTDTTTPDQQDQQDEQALSQYMNPDQQNSAPSNSDQDQNQNQDQGQDQSQGQSQDQDQQGN